MTNGEVAASWQTAGADAMVTPAPNLIIAPNAVRAMADVPGVTHAAAVWNALWETPADAQLNVLAVDPASYAALVASSQGYPQVQAGLIAVPSRAGAPQPVLASPQALADLGRGVVSLSTNQAVVAPVRVQVAGVLSSTPAFLGGGAFVIMPVAAIRSTATPLAPTPTNEMLLNGGSIDHARLAAVVRDMLFGGTVTFRSDVLSGLTDGPLQHGAFTLFTLAVAVAAALGLAVMLLELALGASERDSTLARLATMGLGERPAGLGGGARGAARGHRGGGVRLGLRRGAAPGAGPGHRPVGVHRDLHPGAACGQCRVGCGTAFRPRIGRCGVAWHRDKVGTPTRRSVPSSGRMNGRTW